jgi:hypothetical protein
MVNVDHSRHATRKGLIDGPIYSLEESRINWYMGALFGREPTSELECAPS